MLTGSGIEEISRLSGPVLTAYLNTQPAERARHMPVPASITWLKEAAKSLEPSLAAAEQVLSREQLNRIEEFLRDRHPHEKSVAVFAGRNAWQFVPLQVAVNNDLRWGAPAVSQLLWLDDNAMGSMLIDEAEEVGGLRSSPAEYGVPLEVAGNHDLRWGAPAGSQPLWLVDEAMGSMLMDEPEELGDRRSSPAEIVVPLQVAVNNDLRWGAPAVSQLLWLVDEHRPHCIVVVDRTGARFLRYQLRELLELEEKKFTIDISQWKMKDLGHVTGQRVHKTRGSQRDAFDHRVEAQYERLCRQAAQQAGAIYARERLQAIFLVGKDHLIELIEKDFPKELRHRVTLIKEDLGRSSVHELQNRLEPEIEKWEGQHEKALVDSLLISKRGTVIEAEEALAKLQQGKVRLLVLARDFNPNLRQCMVCGWTDRSADPACPKCGASRRLAALQDVLPGLARKYNVDLEVVSGSADKRLREAGGMGGWLRTTKQITQK